MGIYPLFGRIRGFYERRFQEMFCRLKRFSASEVAQQRAIQEEFVNSNFDIIHDEKLFNKKLADYLIFYNTIRPHKSLGLKSPVQFLIQNNQMSQMFLTYTCT